VVSNPQRATHHQKVSLRRASKYVPSLDKNAQHDKNKEAAQVRSFEHQRRLEITDGQPLFSAGR
jgi:hypothetical protein